VTIYLACTVRGDRAGVTAARTIAARLEHNGHRVLTSHLLGDDVDELEAGVTEQAVFERDVAWLDAARRHAVAEASGSSYGVGFEVGYVMARAAQTGQRVFLLRAAKRSSVSRLVAGNNDRHCRTFATTASRLEHFIDQHLGPSRLTSGSAPQYGRRRGSLPRE
jgi:hypothetical protein